MKIDMLDISCNQILMPIIKTNSNTYEIIYGQPENILEMGSIILDSEVGSIFLISPEGLGKFFTKKNQYLMYTGKGGKIC